MSRKTTGYLTFALGAWLMLGIQAPVSAIEEPQPGFGLWEFDDDDDAPFPSVISLADSFPADPGIEMLGVSGSFEVTTPNGNDKIRSIVQTRAQVRDVDSGALIVEYAIELQSGLYPNPTGTEGLQTTYFCGLDGFFVNPTQDEYPCEALTGFGFANAGGTRMFIFGSSLVGSYSNATSGFVDVSRFTVQGFNLKTGNLRWQRTFPLVDSNDWELVMPFSAAGDFLNGDGNDEIRVVQAREGNNDGTQFRYRYYDAKFGDLVKSITFTTPVP